MNLFKILTGTVSDEYWDDDYQPSNSGYIEDSYTTGDYSTSGLWSILNIFKR